MSDEDDREEGDALDVVLSLDQDPLEVEQYAATDFSSEELEKIGFMESSSQKCMKQLATVEVEAKMLVRK